ncbi:effector-associated constant component EACC1 [Saccharopolyspora shandongensis]|uniref:effector-associated constant component EACC1 n=1 Tax=Saccharopolyspora shandongensis TaxID=418495 RepID=UPI0034099229
MDLTIEVEASELGPELRSLHQWLIAESELRGRVQTVQSPPEPGTLGPTTDALLVALGPGGVATAVATVLVSWIRRRVGDVTAKVTRPDGTTIEVEATNLRDMDVADVEKFASSIARSLEDIGEQDGR